MSLDRRPRRSVMRRGRRIEQFSRQSRESLIFLIDLLTC
jgi:hypothetical protein